MSVNIDIELSILSMLYNQTYILYLISCTYFIKYCISRCVGHTSSGSAGTRNPRLVIVKFTMYEKCKAILTTKRKLKGTNVVITENLTRQRVALLQTAHASLNVIQPGVVRST